MRIKYSLSTTSKLWLINFLGILLTILPLSISILKNKEAKIFNQFTKEQLLIFPEGRKLQQMWVEAPTVIDGIKKIF